MIDRYGGEVALAAGGILVGVFGAAAANEDDPERAVRAALELCTGGGEAGLRIGVDGGPALVTHAHGLSLAGEVMTRTTSLLGSADPGEVLVGMPTVRATRWSIEYDELPAERGHGLAARLARQPMARTAVRSEPDTHAPLIGRGHELALLTSLFDRVRRNREPQLVTVVGVPGIGKSRLVGELARQVEGEPELVTWRQGRSLPYGEGVTFWALGEVVKAQAGILDDDGVQAADAKLAKAVEDALAPDSGSDPDGERAPAAWLTAHLRPLVAGRADAEDVRGQLGQALAAWRTFVEALAERRPLVLVFEDLQWGDDALLDLVEGLTREVGSVPLLVVCVARPELLERRPRWSGGQRDVTIISLGPLTTGGTEELLDALLGGARLPAETVAALQPVAAGNPLFIEEYVRMLRDRGSAQAGSPPELPMPDSVARVIAARLDLLEAGDRELLQDAAVIGEVGWAGALAAVSGRGQDEVAAWLQRVERRDLVRTFLRPSVRGETEFAFHHVLIRDVAYGQLPRAPRAERHRRAAAWIESLSPDRGADQAELLAHHYQQALQLAHAGGEPPAPEVAERARFALRAAGDRARALGVFPTAARFHGAALELWPADDPERPELLLHLGEELVQGEVTGGALLAEAKEGLLAAGQLAQAAEADIWLGLLAVDTGRGELAAEHFRSARALAEQAPPSRSMVAVLDHCANNDIIASNYGDSARLAARTHELAAELGLPELEATTLSTLGLARFYLGEAAGLADAERAVTALEALASTRVVRCCWNLATAMCIQGDLPRGDELAQRAEQWARRFGAGRQAQRLMLSTTIDDYWAGRWDQLLPAIDWALSGPDGRPRAVRTLTPNLIRGRIRLANGELDQALEDAVVCMELARTTSQGGEDSDYQWWDPARSFAARVLVRLGRHDEAEPLVDGLLASVGGRYLNPGAGIDLAMAMAALGRSPAMLTERQPHPSAWLEATLAFVAGDPAGAAVVFARIGSKPDEADAHLAAARMLHERGDAAGAVGHLDAAAAFYDRVGATAYLAETVRLRRGRPGLAP